MRAAIAPGSIAPDALKFNPLDLTGELLPCWLDMIRGVVADRAKKNGKVSREDFENRIIATRKRVAEARAMLIDPAKVAAKIGRIEYHVVSGCGRQSFGGLASRRRIAEAVDDDVGAGLAEAFGNGIAEAGHRPGYERATVLEH